MTMQRFVTGGVEALGEREVGVIASTDQLARDGHILEPRGIALDNYRRNPVVLWQHDIMQPVGAATAVAIEGRNLAARITFAPAGASAAADEVCSLVKAGVIKGVSIGFDPIDVEPIDPKLGSRGGLHITSSELLEISFCSVPVDTGALVVARAHKAVPGAAALLRALPAIGGAAVQRAFAQIGRGRPDSVPFGLLSPAAQAAAIQNERTSRAMATWGHQLLEREIETDMSFEARQRRLQELDTTQ